MGIFKTVQLRWWQGSIFKVSMASFGILIGIYFNEFFSKLTLFLWIIFLKFFTASTRHKPDMRLLSKILSTKTMSAWKKIH